MEYNIYFSDTFTGSPFQGNPTAVLISQQVLPSGLCTGIAREINLPVTAFITDEAGHDRFPLRYFTKTGEIPACGHATLAAADVVAKRYGITENTFLTAKGVHISVRKSGDMIWMDYPVYTTTEYLPPPLLLSSLGISTFKWSGFCRELETAFLELNDPAELKAARPDFKGLLNSDPAIKEVVITCGSDQPEYDFLLRSFCPWIGIDEDPVTGSVHSVLGPYWMAQTKNNKLQAFQASDRGGEVYLDVSNDFVSLGGRVTRIMQGTMNIDNAWMDHEPSNVKT